MVKYILMGKISPTFHPEKSLNLVTAHIPEDRQKDGLVLGFPIADNLVLNTYYLAPFSKSIWLDQNRNIGKWCQIW